MTVSTNALNNDHRSWSSLKSSLEQGRDYYFVASRAKTGPTPLCVTAQGQQDAGVNVVMRDCCFSSDCSLDQLLDQLWTGATNGRLTTEMQIASAQNSRMCMSATPNGKRVRTRRCKPGMPLATLIYKSFSKVLMVDSQCLCASGRNKKRPGALRFKACPVQWERSYQWEFYRIILVSPMPTGAPSGLPSVEPSELPWNGRNVPSATPSTNPSIYPSTSPSTIPTDGPSSQPSDTPSFTPMNELAYLYHLHHYPYIIAPNDPLSSSTNPASTTSTRKKKLQSFQRYLEVECWKQQPDVRGLGNVLQSLADACKQINRIVQRAQTDELYGNYFENDDTATNIQGETPQKLDVLCNTVVLRAFCGGGRSIHAVASEEEDEARCCASVMIDGAFSGGDFVAVFDPIDGSKNIDASLPVGQQ